MAMQTGEIWRYHRIFNQQCVGVSSKESAILFESMMINQYQSVDSGGTPFHANKDKPILCFDSVLTIDI